MYIKMTKRLPLFLLAIILGAFTIMPGFVTGKIYGPSRSVLVFIVVLLFIVSGKRYKWNNRVIPVAILFVVYCDNNYYFRTSGRISTFYILYVVSLLTIILAIYGITDWIDTYIYMLAIMGMVHAICTIGFKFTPGFYSGHIASLYPDMQVRLMQWYNANCMPGLANHYSTNGMYLVLGLYSTVFFIIKHKPKNIYSVMMLGIYMLAILMNGKRAHLIFSIFSLYALYYFYLSNDKRGRSVKMLGIACIAAVVAIIVITYVPDIASAFFRFQETIDEGDVTSHRVIFWALALELFKLHPFLGVGWGQFQNYCEAIVLYRAHAHNVFIQLLCETGVFGVLVYTIWFIVIIVKTITLFVNFRKYGGDSRDIGSLAFSLLVQIFFILYCFTGNPLYESQMFIPYYISCAILFSLEDKRKINE